MAGSKLSCGFSWADEVEKEECRQVEEKKSNKRVNPFGSARPREVVLQEKGIDWRKLDQDFPSHHRAENKLKENTPEAAVPVEGEKPSPRRLRSQKKAPNEIRNRRNVFAEIPVACAFPGSEEEDLSALVPPLMYPPRNIVCLTGGIRTSHRGDLTAQYPMLYEIEFEEVNTQWNRDTGSFCDGNSRPRQITSRTSSLGASLVESNALKNRKTLNNISTERETRYGNDHCKRGGGGGERNRRNTIQEGLFISSASRGNYERSGNFTSNTEQYRPVSNYQKRAVSDQWQIGSGQERTSLPVEGYVACSRSADQQKQGQLIMQREGIHRLKATTGREERSQFEELVDKSERDVGQSMSSITLSI